MSSTGKTAAAILDAVLAKRGYLPSCHRMLGNTAPALLEAYDTFCDQLTLQQRALIDAVDCWAQAAVSGAIPPPYGQ